MGWEVLVTFVGMVISVIGGVWVIETRFERRLDKEIKRLDDKLDDKIKGLDDKIEGLDDKIEALRSLFIDHIAKK